MIQRRSFLTGAGVAATALTMPLSRVAAAAAEALKPMPLPPPISQAERLARVARARTLMQQNGIGSLIVEPGSSLDYLTGVQWHRSERLTAAVIPASGDPIIVTPFFESPSVKETLAIPAEIRTWNEDEEPLKLVADFLRERGVAGAPVAFEETDRYFIYDRLQQQLPGVKPVSAHSVVRALRLIKSPAELALMQAANEITLQAMRHAGEAAKLGMIPADFGAAIDAATAALGGSPEFSLVLIDEAAAQPHGSNKPQIVRRGSTVLFDCGCTVHGYQSDISHLRHRRRADRGAAQGLEPGPRRPADRDPGGEARGSCGNDRRCGSRRLRELGLRARVQASGAPPSHRPWHRNGRSRACLSRPRRHDSARGGHVLLGRAGNLHSGQVRRAPRGLLAHD